MTNRPSGYAVFQGPGTTGTERTNRYARLIYEALA